MIVSFSDCWRELISGSRSCLRTACKDSKLALEIAIFIEESTNIAILVDEKSTCADIDGNKVVSWSIFIWLSDASIMDNEGGEFSGENRLKVSKGTANLTVWLRERSKKQLKSVTFTENCCLLPDARL
jgi:hypothetical protein